jgi:acyl dehydratase
MADQPTTDEKPIHMLGLGLYFDDLSLGQRFRTIGRSIFEADLMTFIGVSGMQEVMFNNLEVIAADAPGGRRFIPGLMALSIAEGLVLGPTLQKTGLAFLNMSMDIKGPVHIGDTIHVDLEVTELRRTSKGARGLVRTRNQVINQLGQTVIEYTPLRLMKARE